VRDAVFGLCAALNAGAPQRRTWRKTAITEHSDIVRGGITIGGGTIVDATNIHARSPSKNHYGERDPEIHQTRKGNQDSRTKLVHSIVATAIQRPLFVVDGFV
jgi:hypothetical protein